MLAIAVKSGPLSHNLLNFDALDNHLDTISLSRERGWGRGVHCRYNQTSRKETMRIIIEKEVEVECI